MSTTPEKTEEQELAKLHLEDILLLQIMNWERPSNENITRVFGEDTVEAFNYAYDLFKGQRRTDCDNPTIAHSYDTAYWVKKFLKGRYSIGDESFDRYMKCSNLHDTIEDKSETIEEVEERFNEIKEKFGKQTADDVMVLTNVYSIIIEQANKMIDCVDGKNEQQELLQAIKAIKGCLGNDLREKYGVYFENINKAARRIKEEEIQNLKEENPLFTYVNCLKFRCYSECYIGGMIKHAKEELKEGKEDYDLPIVIKIADGIDAVRTMAPAKTYSNGKIIKKSEIKVDMFEKFCRWLNRNNEKNLVIGRMVEYLKEEVIDQVKRRIGSTKPLNDTRYALAKGFFGTQFERLLEKYNPTGQIELKLFDPCK